MVTLLPLDGSFIRFAGRFVDESYGMAAGYNCKFDFSKQHILQHGILMDMDTFCLL